MYTTCAKNLLYGNPNFFIEVELKETITRSKQKELEATDAAALNLCKLMNILVYIALGAISFFCVNVATNGDFGRMVSFSIHCIWE